MNRVDDPPAPSVSEAPRFRVVVNHEEQYALWPEGLALPAGWSEAGRRGTREECLAYVEEVWTDMTPKSLRAAPTLATSPAAAAADEAR